MKILSFIIISVICSMSCTSSKEDNMIIENEYQVERLKQPITIDGNWDKPQWQAIEAVELKYFMGDTPIFKPVVHARLSYDSKNLYAIFRVGDRYVRSITTDVNGNVWEDSCVELFFSPDTNAPLKYFNLEINCGGTALMYYNIIPRKEFIILEPEDINRIEIAHSLPRQILHEITDPVTWTIEYKIPFELLEKYSAVTRPAQGVEWKANFYKIADNSSNPHYLTWTLVSNAVPDFHLPQFFGTLSFQ